MIYVTDDHEDSAKYLVHLLKRAGYRAMMFTCGRDLLGQLAVERPRLVVLDMMMPEMSGLQCLEAIRKNEATRLLPVIIYTADFTPETLNGARAAGASEVLLKGSVRFPAFLAVVERLAGPPGS